MPELPALPEDPRLADWARHIETIKWSALILDSDDTLVYASEQVRAFVQTKDDEDLGVGSHILEAFMRDTWLRTAAPESQADMFRDLAPFMVAEYTARGKDAAAVVPEQFAPLLASIEPKEPPQVWTTSFLYVDPAGEGELPDYRVNLFFTRLYDPTGDLVGSLLLFAMDVRPNLLALLARGDQEMYLRMAKLVEPGPRQAAVLFCDLHGSFGLSRQLPSATYFRLVRRLWSGIDAVVARETGIVGKHAGDGASAFFLVDDLGSPSAAVAAAVRAARAIHDVSGDVFREIVDSDCLMKVGIHWGGSLYMGQLVPGGRLDVTALGDEVNEAARVQETAGPGETLVSKQLLERLTEDDAASLGLDLDKLLYRPLAEAERASEKAIRDAGGLAITSLTG